MIDNIDFIVNELSKLQSMTVTSGSSISKNIACKPSLDTVTGSFKINSEWWIEQYRLRSGQNFQIVENQSIEANSNEVNVNALEIKIETIKSVFAMTEAEIAETIGVSRKTLFNWKQRESAPNKKKAQNIFELFLLAKNWNQAGFTKKPFDLQLPIVDGLSVKDLLKEAKLDSEKILFAGNRLSHKNLGETELF